MMAREQVRAREQESKRAREQESKRAREQESKRAREQESKRAREQESSTKFKKFHEQKSRRSGQPDSGYDRIVQTSRGELYTVCHDVYKLRSFQWWHCRYIKSLNVFGPEQRGRQRSRALWRQYCVYIQMKRRYG
jgi:hypothetical protein